MNTRNLMFVMLGLASVILVIIIIALASQTADGLKSCPADYVAHPPLILVSMDGFRASYRDRGLTPTINRLAEEGVSAPFMVPIFPTVTLPNHYTIVTGLYPESHGIVANSFTDHKLGKFDPSSSRNTTEWWGGVPIWNLVTQHDHLKSAAYMWVGSDAEIGGMRPTHWLPFNYTTPFEDRVKQVLEWVKMEPEDRPAWISVYFSEPDHTGHQDGPYSDAVKEQLKRMDGIIKMLVTGLEEDNLLDCVNLILVSDHGMAGGGESWTIKLTDFNLGPAELATYYTGPFTMLSLKNGSEGAKKAAMDRLACNRSDMRVYEKEGLPKRLHYSYNDRIEDLLIEMDPGRMTEMNKSETYRNGNHGYDNYFTPMDALFLARGPGFKSGVVTRPFQNIQLYNVMCHLTGIQPAPNNGTVGALNDILIDPVPIKDIEINRPPVAAYPDNQEIPNRLILSGCSGDLTKVEDWLDRLDNTAEEQETLESKHAPWGLPQLVSEDPRPLLLHQPDHVTGYSASRKTPLWASFTLRGAPGGTPQSDEWVSDVRLDADVSPNCKQYDKLDGAIKAPLFYPGFSSNSSLTKIPYLVSNLVPSTGQQQKHWEDLMGRVVMGWLGSGSSLNLIVGPVFDLNSDSKADPFDNATSYPKRPSDLFAIVTRCISGVNLADCEHQHLDTRSFIFPTELLVENCVEHSEYALKYSSTLQDVRIATDLVFFPALDAAQRVRLETSIHQTLW